MEVVCFFSLSDLRLLRDLLGIAINNAPTAGHTKEEMLTVRRYVSELLIKAEVN